MVLICECSLLFCDQQCFTLHNEVSQHINDNNDQNSISVVLKCNGLLEMAKRHCTMTADEVQAMMDVSDGDMGTASSDERSDDELELDDLTNPS